MILSIMLASKPPGITDVRPVNIPAKIPIPIESSLLELEKIPINIMANIKSGFIKPKNAGIIMCRIKPKVMSIADFVIVLNVIV